MKNLIRDMTEFNQRFELPHDNRQLLEDDPAWIQYRLGFLQEELNETRKAAEYQDHHEILDGLVDLIYVAVGTAVSLGYPLEEAWRRVHAANLAKIRVNHPDESKRGTLYDLRKPGGWVKPDFGDIL